MLGSYETNHIYNTDALTLFRGLPDGCIHCIVTSPPYFGLRDYGIDGQLGLEETPEAYVAALAQVFREARRVLRDDGTLWLNLGDSYVGATSEYAEGGSAGHNSKTSKKTLSGLPNEARGNRNRALYAAGLPMKSLLMIPARVALALQADGWWLRSDIIWAKPNPMPESVTDRPTKSHEHLFLLAKSASYYYDAAAIAEPAVGVSGGGFSQKYAEQQPEHGAMRLERPKNHILKQDAVGKRQYTGFNERWDNRITELEVRNKRDVWTIPTQAFPGAHFAVMPEALVQPCILAGCPEGGVTLDPFMGSGTVARVAHRLGRRYIGCDINPAYVEMARSSLGQMSLYEALP